MAQRQHTAFLILFICLMLDPKFDVGVCQGTSVANTATTFVNNYFRTLETAKENIGSFYHTYALLTFEGQQFSGRQAIVANLEALPFQNIQHTITTIDSQTTTDGGIITLVVGQMEIDDMPPLAFVRTFYLKPVNGAYLLFNDIWRQN